MNRCFSKKQREALELHAGGKCSLCGVRLPAEWHADHKIPFSKGGMTDVINGQALCPDCNLRKGNSMKPTLRKWQSDATKLCTNTFSKQEKLFLAHVTPGGGKTILGLAVYDSMRQRAGVSHLLVLVPSTTLVHQWQDEAHSLYDVELKPGMLYKDSADFSEYQGVIMTYQGMNENAENLRIFCSVNRVLIVADELHHVADGQKWAESFRKPAEQAQHILGLTGTPWATEGREIPYVNYDENGYAKADFTYSKEAAIKDRVCRVTQFRKTEALDLIFRDGDSGEEVSRYDSLQGAVDDEYPKALLKAMSSLKHFNNVFMQADEEVTHLRDAGIVDAAGLLVAPNIAIAHAFQDNLFALTGETYPIVHSKMDKPHNDIKKFRNSRDRWLISVAMVTEGVDIKRLQVVAYFGTIMTELFLRQLIGRAERVRNPEDHMDLSCHFFYTDLKELNDLVDKFEQENQMGLELRKQNSEERKDRSKTPFQEDTDFLDEVRSVCDGLIAKGFKYDPDVVAEALRRVRAEPVILGDIPLFMLCKTILAERNTVTVKPTPVSPYDAPLSEKKSRLRTLISKEISRKIYALFNGKPPAGAMKKAHNNINKRAGITTTNDSVSLEQFERKMEVVSTTGANSWLT